MITRYRKEQTGGMEVDKLRETLTMIEDLRLDWFSLVFIINKDLVVGRVSWASCLGVKTPLFYNYLCVLKIKTMHSLLLINP